MYQVIVGTGDLAYALAHLFHINNTNDSGNFLEVTKPSLQESGKSFHETGVPLSPIDEALEHADIVILAIPAKALKSFVPNYIMALKDKVLIDCTNSSREGEDLESLVTNTNIRWVKAFNDLGAVDILTNKVTTKKRIVTKMCSPSKSAIEVARRLAQESFGIDVKVVPYSRYEDIARNQNSIGQQWAHSAYILIVIFVLTEFYACWRYNVEKGYEWFHLPMQVTNKAICWTAITGFALTQLPGVIARIGNYFRSNLSDLSPTLKWALQLRKELGILSLWFLGLHILMSMILFNPAYYGKFFIDPTANTSKMNVIGETSFLFATVGSMFYFILGLASLPSVSSNMTNQQWQLIYGPLAWAALAFGTSHVIIMGFKGWDDHLQDEWPGGMPPITLTSVLIPMLVLFLKVIEIGLFLTSSLCRRSIPKSDDDMQYIRTVIQAGSLHVGGNDSGNDSDGTHSSGKSKSTCSTVSVKMLGNFECEIVEDQV
ncbi:Metalloreductase STEAP4 [Seminavis robusta]|uniref:Metalloreductase STEAP4 n=1 Tax=Seminavis robusta TaxID=568900 RepID=A0A9N8HPE6_9STRA|nr:Metalloreductase STEAP4 [Seminavis robusta]|eukprot:Sro1321_g262490.1 Metalloreductase STEAP4 (487) ;mRNA; r:14319-16238